MISFHVQGNSKTNNTRSTKCPVFSVSADEAADCSNKEQLPLVLRFVNATNSIHEEFVEFVFCTSGSAIADKIIIRSFRRVWPKCQLPSWSSF